MNTRSTFFKPILQYYAGIANNKISNDLLIGMSEKIADYYFDQYNSFKIKYPKSAERYSSFDLKDLDHPTTFELIITFFKEKQKDDYSGYAALMLNMTADELRSFEKNREDFYNIF